MNNFSNVLKPKHLISFLFILFLLSAIPITLKLTEQPKKVTTPKAAENEAPVAKTPEPTFLANELLIKVTREAKGKIKEDPQDTGISSLDKIFKEHKIKGFSQIAKETKNSLPNHELFQWCKITTEDQPEKINASLDKVTKKITADLTKKNIKILKEAAPTEKEATIIKLQSLMDELFQNNNIEEIEPNYIVSVANVPNDPYYSNLWGLKAINAVQSWDITTGGNSPVVAVIDTGVDRNHSDIAANMWVNTKEIPNNKIDDDNNGYIDDYYGWNFVEENGDPMDDHGHGTHCAGTIGAVGNNNLGVVGVNWTTKIMALKFLNSSGSGYSSNANAAMAYAADMNTSGNFSVRVTSNSCGGSGFSSAYQDAIKYAHERGIVTVVAAGNESTNALDFSPASADLAITVSAVNEELTLASFSNYGEKIDVAAPGVNILSLKAVTNNMCGTGNTVDTYYCSVSGTSMAAPHVAGLVTLLLSKYPTLNPEEVRQIIRRGADDLGPVGKDASFGYGKIDAYKTLQFGSSQPLTPLITAPTGHSILSGNNNVVLGTAGGNLFSRFEVKIGAGRNPQAWTTINESSIPVSNGVLANLDTAKYPDGNYIIRLAVYKQNDPMAYEYQINEVEFDNVNASISYPSGLIPLKQINIIGTAIANNNITFNNYYLEWGESNSPTVWSKNGITLVNNGQLPVSNNLLGSWETSNLNPGQLYSLRLSLVTNNGTVFSTVNYVTPDGDIQLGFPITYKESKCKTLLPANEYCSAQSPVLADIDGDGQKEIIVSQIDSIAAYKNNGVLIAGFPVMFPQGQYGNGPPVVEDINNDGKKEILIDVAQTDEFLFPVGYPFIPKKVYIYTYDGKIFPGWPIPLISNHYGQAPAVADINKDGRMEIVVNEVYANPRKTRDRQVMQIHAWYPNGTEATGFPKIVTGSSYKFHSEVFIFDLDKNGYSEIGFIQANDTQNNIFLLDHTGQAVQGWPYKFDATLGSSQDHMGGLATGDVDGDGQDEIVTAIDHFDTNTGYIFALKKNGTVVPNFPVGGLTPWNGLVFSTAFGRTPSLTDINNDKKEEIFFGLGGAGFNLYKIQNAQLYKTSFIADYQPALVDINGDFLPEIISTATLNFAAWPQYSPINIINNSFVGLWEKNIIDNLTFASPSISDLDNDKKMELAVIETVSLSKTEQQLYLYVWKLPFYTNSIYDWPMSGHDPKRSGRLPVASFASFCSACSAGLSKNLGNANCDSKVNSLDFAKWKIVYTATGLIPENDKAAVDFNCLSTDTVHAINIEDFLLWSSNYQ